MWERPCRPRPRTELHRCHYIARKHHPSTSRRRVKRWQLITLVCNLALVLTVPSTPKSSTPPTNAVYRCLTIDPCQVSPLPSLFVVSSHRARLEASRHQSKLFGAAFNRPLNFNGLPAYTLCHPHIREFPRLINRLLIASTFCENQSVVFNPCHARAGSLILN